MEEVKNKKKNTIATICIVLVLVLSALYLFVPMFGGYNWLAWILAIANLIAGPAALLGYLNEVRKGVFKEGEEEDPEQAQ